MKKFIYQLSALQIVFAIFSSSVFAAQEKLIFALDLVRHGDRAAYDDLPAAPHTFAEGSGQLTALGMQQEYQLGLKLRELYIIKDHLLTSNYQPDTIYIHSTDIDRTIMSAQSLALGLYPLGTGPKMSDASPALPSGYQPLPIHTIPTDQDSALLINLSDKKISALINKYVYTSTDWKTKSATLSAKYERWSQLTGMPITSMFDVINLSDTLRAYLTHDIALPNGLTTEEANNIISEGDWIYASLLKPNAVGDAAGKPALQQIISYIQQAADKKSKAKLVIISAHDVTTMGVMSALHAPLDTTPAYAADLNFSLYEYGPQNYVIKVTYNDMPVNIPSCNGNTCTLNQLIKLI